MSPVSSHAAVVFIGSACAFVGFAFLAQRLVLNYWLHFRQSVDHELGRAFVFVSPLRLLIVNIGFATALAISVFFVAGSVWPALVVAVLFALLPRVFLQRLRQRRAELFRQQLPEAIALLAGGLRAGSSLSGALAEVASQLPAPVGQEVALALRESRMGSTLDKALLALERRLPTEETTLMVGALRIAIKAGGNIAPTLEALSDSMRTKLVLEAKIRALTAQGKLQAWVMGLLPFAVLFAMLAMDPQLSNAYFGSLLGWCVLGLVALLQGVGALLIRRTVSIEI